MKKRAIAFILAAAAAGALAQTSGGFRFDGPLSRVITPNGDGINDVAILCFDNPSESEVDGKVYTLLGSEVATFQSPKKAAGSSCPPGNPVVPNEEHVDWDPRAQGMIASGVYVYQVKAEGRTFTGTLLVVR